jgi:hypothetical protein
MKFELLMQFLLGLIAGFGLGYFVFGFRRRR